MPWAVESLQVVWFKPDVQYVDARSVFAGAYGREPDSYQSNRSITPTTPFLNLASSNSSGVLERVQVGPGRIDLQISMAQNPEVPFPTLPSGPHDAIDALPDIVAGATAVVGTAYRVAIVTNLVRPADTAEEAAAVAAKYFGFHDWTDAIDANFQINRRKRFDGSQLLMNRLLRQNTVAVQGFALSVPQPGAFSNIPTSTVAHGTQYMVDLNVVPTGAEFPPDVLISLFGELRAEAHRIVECANIEEALS